MRILVTGGAGFIGSHTVKALAAQGIEAVTLDNLSTGFQHAMRWGEFIEGDIGDPVVLRQAFRDHPVDGVIHFAASAYVGESVVNPGKYFRNNVSNMLVLLESMVEAGVRTMVFSSSCATYGIPDSLPISEDTEQRPVNPYGETKLFGERMLQAFADAHGLSWVALRYFNAAGADTEGELGENHDPETHLIPLVIDAATGAMPQVSVMGTDYPTPDGTAVRDFIHVNDLADAHIRAMRYLADGGANVALNLGTGQGYSVREIISAVGDVSGMPEFPSGTQGGGPAIRLHLSPMRAVPATSWDGRPNILTSRRLYEPPGSGARDTSNPIIPHPCELRPMVELFTTADVTAEYRGETGTSATEPMPTSLAVMQRPNVAGKFLLVDGKKYFIKGVTYGTFRLHDDGSEYDRQKVDADFSQMAAAGINTVRVYTVPRAGYWIARKRTGSA